MQWIGEAWRRLTFFFRCGQFQRELKEEMDEHVRMKQKDLTDEGMPPDEARNAARREFGNALLLREKSRDPWGFRWLETLLQDLRYGLRQLRRNPGFAAVAIITLALGIGANTAVFSVVDSVLLRQISYRDASRLVWLTNYDLYFKQDDYGPLGDYRIWKKQARSFESMTAYGNEDLTLMTDRGAAQERIASITGDFWSITGAHPALGRLFGPAEQHTMVLSHTLFERRFGSDPHIIGTTVTLNGYPFTVTGVLQPKFRFLFPQQFSVDEPRDIDAYIPFPNAVVAPGNPIYFPGEAEKYGPAPSWVCVVGKLRSHVAIATARAQMETIYARIAREYPTPGHKITILHFVPLQQKLVAGVRPALLVLLGAVGFVLLIATSNVANLLLARASTRQREMAIRTAIGAGRLRIIRQLLAESILLALIGGVAGLLLARWALAVIVRVGSDVIPGAAQTTIDGRVLLFALGTSVMTGILFGLAPALSFWRGNLHDALKDNARPASASTGGLRMLRLLVTAQLALATVLLTGAGLMLKSFRRMNTYPPGFAPRKVLVMRIPFSGPKYKAWLREDEYRDGHSDGAGC
jgi:predicted permease